MDLTLSAEQEMLVDAARRFLARAWSLADTRATERDPRGFRPEVWRAVVALERGAAGVAVTRLATLGGDPVYEVVLDGARGEPLGAPGAAGAALVRTLDRGAVATLAYMVGAAERALEMTVDHARTRVQF